MTSANHSLRPIHLRVSVLHSSGCGGTPKVIGRGRTNPPSKTKGATVRGFTPTCIARKAIRVTPLTGTAGLANPSAANRSMRNGSTS